MDQLTPEDGQSKDIIGENIEALKALFPDAFTEDGIDFDVLRQLLGDEVADGEEKYGLTWHGKKKARQIALTPSTGTLRPCPEESVDWETTQNLFIEGDNLEVLKLLQRSYAGKVKMIYIDPPYNTGKEFIYPDKFQENLDTYLRYTGQKDADGLKLSSNAEASGRYHTNWLSMMVPRLKLAANLMTQDGFLVVSIDDSELANLRLLLDELLGEENQIASLVWDRNRKNDAKFFSVGHEYMLVYAKNKDLLKERGVILREPRHGIDKARELFARLRKRHGDDWVAIQKDWREYYRALPDSAPEKQIGRFSKVGEHGPYRDDGDISWPGGGGPRYEVLHPITKQACKTPKGGWVYSTHERFTEEVDKGRVVFGPDHTTLPRQARYLFGGEGQVMPSVFYSYAQTATMEFVELMGARVFDNPKNYKDLKRIIRYLTEPGDTVLDFFSGSCSTAHGVLAVNAEEEGPGRRFIMVQLPEPTPEDSVARKAGYKTISEVGAGRIRAAARSIQESVPESSFDGGFKVFKLDSSNIQAWNPDRGDLDQTLLDHQAHLVDGRSEQDVLYELLLKRGVDLTVPIEEREAVGKTIYSIGYGVLFACLADKIAKTDIEALAQSIVDWHRELAPETDTQVVFRDSAFEDDIAKSNMTAILEQNGISHVRSL